MAVLVVRVAAVPDDGDALRGEQRGECAHRLRLPPVTG
jgi:hypothetical protein